MNPWPVYQALTSKLACTIISNILTRRSLTYLIKIGRDDRSISEFPASELLQSRLGSFSSLKLDENLADTGALSAAA
jgi:hypothetical protein